MKNTPAFLLFIFILCIPALFSGCGNDDGEAPGLLDVWQAKSEVYAGCDDNDNNGTFSSFECPNGVCLTLAMDIAGNFNLIRSESNVLVFTNSGTFTANNDLLVLCNTSGGCESYTFFFTATELTLTKKEPGTGCEYTVVYDRV